MQNLAAWDTTIQSTDMSCLNLLSWRSLSRYAKCMVE